MIEYISILEHYENGLNLRKRFLRNRREKAFSVKEARIKQEVVRKKMQDEQFEWSKNV